MNKILKISAIVILAVAIVYVIVATFFASNVKTNSNYKAFGSMVSSSCTSTTSTDELEVDMDKILINLHNGPYRYMKADISFRMKDENNKENIEKAMVHVRDAILRYSSVQDSSILATPDGKEKYKEGLKDMLYNTFGFEVDGVYFRNFVLAP